MIKNIKGSCKNNYGILIGLSVIFSSTLITYIFGEIVISAVLLAFCFPFSIIGLILWEENEVIVN